MSVKRKSYSADFKAKLVLEVLEGEKTINEIASKYEVLPVSLKNWKKQFLENMSLAFDKSTVVKEYKDEIVRLKQKSLDEYLKIYTSLEDRNRKILEAIGDGYKQSEIAKYFGLSSAGVSYIVNLKS